MKIKYVFLSMLACCTMAACSNDEVAEGSNNGNVSLEGESYMAIRLVASNETGARASEGNPAFELGTGDENEVTSAEFYFYDDEGTFVVKGKTISSFEWTDQTAGSNIESISKVMVVLEKVPEAPTQVLAVLNGGTVVGDLTNMNMTQALAKSGTFSASVSGDIQVDGESADLEITVNGWGLSGTNKSAYCVKNIQKVKKELSWETFCDGLLDFCKTL